MKLLLRTILVLPVVMIATLVYLMALALESASGTN